MKEIEKDSATKWTEKDLPDLTGKTIIITGANSGTGFAAAKFMSARGATVVMACRNADKAKAALQSIKSGNASAKLEFIPLDLSNLASIEQFSETFKNKYDSLDALINNAGMCQTPELKTKDGFEMQMGVNHLGHYALTGRLMDRLTATKDSRVVTMASMNHEQGQINFDNLFLTGEYHQMRAYEQSKLANLLFAYELSRKLTQAGVGVESIAAHPGFVKSNIMKSNEYTTRSFGFNMMFNVFNLLLAMTPEKGSLGIMRAATDRTLENGDYVGPTKMNGFRGFPKLLTSSENSYNENDAAKLWEMSEELTGVKYAF
ncbi:MAG: SDR family NAD(P)-dependent oxidoreductase [Chloroflexi bacterium]|nr:SDR family NAD(P)-dependent oxidoreductase [Chloroflexota bacterium]